MATLLSLPQELRAIILEYALNAAHDPPSDPWNGAEAQARQPCRDIIFDAWSFGPRHTLYAFMKPHASILTSTPLLLINRQLHDETADILQRRFRLCYRLDVMVINEVDVWPTWVSVLVLRTLVDEVRVSFRAFGHCITPQALRSTSGDGGHNRVEWCFYAMLERFLVRGPIGATDTQDDRILPEAKDPKNWRFYINTLILDVQPEADTRYSPPPPEVTWNDYFRYNFQPFFRPHGIDLSQHSMPPEWLARKLCFEINRLPSSDGYGEFLYDHVSTIRVLVEGQLHKQFDLVRTLASRRRTSA